MNLEEFRARILTRLMDATGLVWSDASADEALRAALGRYSQACPRVETALLEPGPDGTLDVTVLAGRLTGVLAAEYPWREGRPGHNRARGWRIYRSGAALELALLLRGGAAPAGGQAWLVFSARREVAGLDAAESTTVEPEHETLLVTGAAAEALVARAARRAESGQLDAAQSRLLYDAGRADLAVFLDGLEQIRLTGWDVFIPATAGELLLSERGGWQT